MFASPFASNALSRTQRGGLYQQVGVETRVNAADPHQLVLMLFDGFLEALAQGRGAMRGGHRAAKGAALGRAVRIIEEGLRAGLDLRAGGALARDLDELYAYLTMRLTLANLRDDEALLDECQRLVTPLREAWLGIAPAVGSGAMPKTASQDKF
jgi:flagellar secretion chaperone FliS